MHTKETPQIIELQNIAEVLVATHTTVAANKASDAKIDEITIVMIKTVIAHGMQEMDTEDIEEVVIWSIKNTSEGITTEDIQTATGNKAGIIISQTDADMIEFEMMIMCMSEGLKKRI